MTSRSGYVAKYLFVDLVGSAVWFPLWWYTTGLEMVIASSLRALRYRSAQYAFRIWVRNFFVPMYGQYDWTGRAISVLMRFVVLVGRGIALVVESLIYGLGVLLWMLAPVMTVLMGVVNMVQAIR